jgi:hypothetical protein
MTAEKPNPASAAARTGSGNALCFGSEDLPDKPPATKNQAKILRLVRPPRARRIDVMIAARDGPAPIGRTRPIKLTELDFALRLEERA